MSKAAQGFLSAAYILVRRRQKPAENAAHWKWSHLWMKTLCHPFDLLKLIFYPFT
jgi:hypothetical protein